MKDVGDGRRYPPAVTHKKKSPLSLTERGQGVRVS